MTTIRAAKSVLTRSAWTGLLALAVLLVLFVGTAPGSPDQTYIVNSTADPGPATCDSTTCTLHAAIALANNDNDVSKIQFAIQGSGPQTIQLTQNLPAITAPVTIDGTTQLGLSATTPGITVLGGSGVTQGLDLAGSGGSTVRGLALGEFSGTATEAAVVVESDGNLVAGNYVGVQADSTTEADNQLGIFVEGGSNTIGGSTAADRNVVVNSNTLIANTNADGILVQGNGSDAQAMNNQILGNYVGLLPDGSTLARNEQSGIQVIDSQGTEIGGGSSSDGNVIVGKNGTDAIALGDFNASTFGGHSTVENNLIQLSADGSHDYPDSGTIAGINVQDTGSNQIADNTIGGTNQGIDICNSPDNTVVGNVIGSNTASSGGPDFGVIDQGISIEQGTDFCPQGDLATGNVIGGDSADGNTIIGSQLNDVAVDAGQNEVSYNTLRGTKGGADVEIGGSNDQIENNTITAATTGGPSTPGYGVDVSGSADSTFVRDNVVSGNSAGGIDVSGATNTTITGNEVGTDSTGSVAVGNGTGDGIDVDGADGTVIGGPGEGQANVISGNDGDGIHVSGDCLNGFTARGNLIGLDGTGTSALGNGGAGIRIDGTCDSNNTVADNVISGNTDGVVVFEDGAEPTTITGNLVGTDASGTASVGNTSDGILLESTFGGVTVGGTDAASRNVVSGNGGYGIHLYGGDDAVVEGNYVGVDASGTAAVPNAAGGIGVDGASSNTIGGTDPGGGNLVSGNDGAGIALVTSVGGTGVDGYRSPDDNTIEGNDVGVDASGTSALPNTGNGILVTSANNTIGGSDPGAGNVVSGNGLDGVTIQASTATNNLVAGNLIGTDADGTSAIANSQRGVFIAQSAADNTIGGRSAAERNVISGNGSESSGGGIAIGSQPGTGNVVLGNYIGTDATGSSALPNAHFGVAVDGSGETVGDTDGGGNSIAFNGGPGVLVSSGAGDAIRQNSIHDNGGLGIELGSAANDGQNAPALSQAMLSSGSLTVGGSLQAPDRAYVLDVFQSPTCDASGGGEGKTFVGELDVITSSGTASFSQTVSTSSTDPVVTVTATAPDGSTSEFSNCASTNGIAGGALSGGVDQSVVKPVDLTALGSADWALWGYNSSAGVGQPASALTPNETRANGGRQISDLSIVNGDGTATRGFAYANDSLVPLNFSWTDGAPDATVSGGHAGLTAPKVGQGLSFTVPAGTAARTLTIWTSAHYADGTLTAHLSDGSAPDFTQTIHAVRGDFTNAGENAPAIFTLRYHAASAGQHLTVTWTQAANNNCGGCEDVVLYAAALSAPLSNLTVNASPSSIGAGIDQVSISAIPNAFLSFYAGSTTSTPVGSTPVGSTPVGSTPVGSTPVGSTPVGSTPVGSTPVGSTPVGSTPVGSTSLLDLPVGSTPVGSTALSSLLLSQIPLCGDTPLSGTTQAQCVTDGATWSAVLNGTPLAGKPLNALTLADVAGNATAKSRLNALPLRDVSFATTLFRSVHWASLLLGSTPLSDLPGWPDAWCGTGGLILEDGGSCTGATGSTTVLQMDVAGQLGSAPVGSTPVGSTNVSTTPVGSTPVGSTDIPASKLANIPLADVITYDGDLPLVVNCAGSFSCGGKTLGDAYNAGAILSSAKFSYIAGAMAHNGITIDDILIAVLSGGGATGLPWEQLPLQGLQPYSLTKPRVHYTVSTSVDCSVVSQFSITAHLPDGFFPVDGTALIAVGANPPSSEAPTVLGGDASAAQKLNAYQWTASCPAGDNNTETATLTFDSWVGLALGTFETQVDASTTGYSISTTDAPVTVHQNSEAQDPSSAAEIQPDKLVAGHIAFGGEQAFYKVKLDGLAAGTRVSAFLNVPSNADLDLTMSAPAAPSLFSSPVGSTPVGSTPIEDSAVGFSTNGQALPPDTLQDVPVGSTPVGSTPVGSTPVGSTSANRGEGVNEAGAIITTAGETGYATIGVSGYNGASSNQPFVLRVKETPPPTLPPSCPAPTFPNGSPSNFAAGTLPNTLSTSTKTLFLVNKQRLTAMYRTSAVTSLLSSLNTLASRSEVSGSVLFVDGNAAVRSAYTAWDQHSCDTSARNNVVKAINDVVTGYRANNGLPNLHYIVLVGSDQAGPPMADAQDPVLLSPEENEAADLAFTTSGGTLDNSLYASAAQNQILTDGAYGAFTNIQWLGRSLLLPQLSVSRLVESPTDILGQINRYLKANGYTGTPQTGVGTLTPTSATVTGYDFLADGSQSVANNLAHQFGVTVPSTFTGTGDQSIFNPPTTWKANTTYKAGDVVQPTSASPFAFQATTGGTSGALEPAWPSILGAVVGDHGISWKAIAPWSPADVSSVFGATTPASIVALNGHYNHYELEAANGGLAADTQAAAANLAARILFTMGCHGGLNVADSLPGGSLTSPTAKYLDWPEQYAKAQAAVYIGNTGFGYGDSASVALSERLLSLFARNLHSNSDSVGEQWAETLGQYFATAGAYDVYDEKVMEETTFYGLPFWHFGTAPVTPLSTALSSLKQVTGTSSINSLVSSASLSTTNDPNMGGTPSTIVNFPSTGATTTQSQFGLYRPILPITSQEVTSSTGPATGAWITSLATNDAQNVTPTLGYPTIDLHAHEPVPNFQPIFFPASPFTLEHSLVFGNDRDYLNVSDQFRPNEPADGKGTQRHVVNGTFEVLYGNTSDRIAPLISDVQVAYSSGTANIAVRVSDPSNPVLQVAALVNDGSWHYVQLSHTSDPTLWTGTATGLLTSPEVFSEATDGTLVSYSANKGENFTSTSTLADNSAQIVLQDPIGTYAKGETVNASFSCLVGGSSAAGCNATLDGNPTPLQNGAPIDTTTLGQHTIVVTALNADGSVIATLERTYTVVPPAVFSGLTFVNAVNSGGGQQPNCTQKSPFNSGTNDVNTFPAAICSSDGNAPAPSTFAWQVELAGGTPQSATPAVDTGLPIAVHVTKVTTHGTNHGTPPVLLNGNSATLTIPTGSSMTSTALKVGNIGGGDWIQVTVSVTVGTKTSTLEMQVH